jgi:hypothetical protein
VGVAALDLEVVDELLAAQPRARADAGPAAAAREHLVARLEVLRPHPAATLEVAAPERVLAGHDEDVGGVVADHLELHHGRRADEGPSDAAKALLAGVRIARPDRVAVRRDLARADARVQGREEESDEEDRAAHMHDPSTRRGRGSIEAAGGPTGRGAGCVRGGEGALFTELPPGDARRVLR